MGSDTHLEGQSQVTSQQSKGQLEIISFEKSERLCIESVHKEKLSLKPKILQATLQSFPDAFGY
jgi:hypothetical protein